MGWIVRLTVKADLVALATLRQCNSISSTSTSLVSSMPRVTMARLSPTRIMSIPATSATSADGKSYAVITLMGSFFLCIDRRAPRVTFFRWFGEGVPMGEWEEYLVWKKDRSGVVAMRAVDGRDEVRASEAAHVRRLDDNESIMNNSRCPIPVVIDSLVGCWQYKCKSKIVLYLGIHNGEKCKASYEVSIGGRTYCLSRSRKMRSRRRIKKEIQPLPWNFLRRLF